MFKAARTRDKQTVQKGAASFKMTEWEAIRFLFRLFRGLFHALGEFSFIRWHHMLGPFVPFHAATYFL